MINPTKSAVWSTTKRIAPFSCTPRVQEVHTKAEVVHLTPGLLAKGYYSIVTHRKYIAKHMINPRISAVWITTKPIAKFLVHHVYKKYIPKLRSYTFPLVS